MSKAGVLKKPLLVIKTTDRQSQKTLDSIQDAVKPIAKEIGASLVLVDGSMDAHVYQDSSRLSQAIEANTQAVLKVIEINSALLHTLAEMEEGQEEIEPSHYMDGKRV